MYLFSQKVLKEKLQAHKKLWSNAVNITRHYATSLSVQAVDSFSDSNIRTMNKTVAEFRFFEPPRETKIILKNQVVWEIGE